MEILEKYLSRNSIFRLKPEILEKLNPIAGIPVLFLLYYTGIPAKCRFFHLLSRFLQQL